MERILASSSQQSDTGGISPPPSKRLRTEMHSDALTTKNKPTNNGDSNHLKENPSTSAVLKNTNIANGDTDVSDKTTVKRGLTPTDKEIIRIVGQQLQEMGFIKASETLMSESGCKLEHSITTRLREQIMDGEWSRVQVTLKEMQPLVKHQRYIQKMLFLVLQQKYLELIEENKFVDALLCLRNEIQPLKIYISRVHQLPSFLMITNRDELLKAANWCGKGIRSRTKLLEKLQSYLPMSVMMPPSRLRTLLTQALDYQQSKCLFHNSDETPVLGSYSLLLDHVCHRRNFPVVTKQVLNQHTNEVWFCQFSNNGKMLATGSKDSNLILWNVDQNTHAVTYSRTIQCQASGVGYASWSHDDKFILACGAEDANELYIYNTQTGGKETMSHAAEDSLVCCCWSSDDSKFVTGGIKGQFYECDSEGNILQTWEGVRVQALGCRPDSSTYLAADSQHRVRSYNFDEEIEENILKEEASIMSMNVSSDGRYLLVNLSNQGIHLWDLDDKVRLRKFQGSKQTGAYQLYSTFGGASDLYVASGSEDGKVYIWHRSREEPIEVLSGHTKVVSCVSWNKAIPSMLASCSDDYTVRIWGPQEHCESYEDEEDDDYNKDDSKSSADDDEV